MKVLRLPWKFDMIFFGIVENYWCKNYLEGVHLVGNTHQAAPPMPGAARGVLGPTGPPSLIPFVHILPSSPKQISISLFPVFLLPNLRFSISLLRAPFPKLFWRITTWYVTPPLVQLVFLLVVYILSS